MQNPSAGKAGFACGRFAAISDEDRVIALLKKVLKSGSMTDTDDSDIIANSVARQENGMQMPNGRNCGFSRFFHGNFPFPAVDFRQSACYDEGRKRRVFLRTRQKGSTQFCWIF